MVRRFGRLGYRDACLLQDRAAAEVAAGAPDRLLFVEHPPVVTVGRGADPGQLRASVPELESRGISVRETDRGGGVTYHGPGQLVGYPVVALRRRGLSVRGYLGVLEAALVEVLRGEGLEVGVRPGLTGVWNAAGKVAAIGIAVRRGISRHGFALNVDPDLGCFDLIVPCGLPEPVTSMAALGWKGSRAGLPGAIAAALGRHLVAAASGPGVGRDGGRHGEGEGWSANRWDLPRQVGEPAWEHRP